MQNCVIHMAGIENTLLSGKTAVSVTGVLEEQ
jgi:hypothetical protein